MLHVCVASDRFEPELMQKDDRKEPLREKSTQIPGAIVGHRLQGRLKVGSKDSSLPEETVRKDASDI